MNDLALLKKMNKDAAEKQVQPKPVDNFEGWDKYHEPVIGLPVPAKASTTKIVTDALKAAIVAIRPPPELNDIRAIEILRDGVLNQVKEALELIKSEVK